ncbi:MscL family protein, partial [Escherichia coli]|nr:MscL family protein [Escherichia coli]
AYGNFITIAINFLLLAFVVFLMVKSINKLKSKQTEAPATEPSVTEKLLSEIRDELKRN